MHEYTIYSNVKDSQIVPTVMVSNLSDADFREPVRDQLSMPMRGLVKTSVIAVLNVHLHFGISLIDL